MTKIASCMASATAGNLYREPAAMAVVVVEVAVRACVQAAAAAVECERHSESVRVRMCTRRLSAAARAGTGAGPTHIAARHASGERADLAGASAGAYELHGCSQHTPMQAPIQHGSHRPPVQKHRQQWQQ